MDDVRYDLRSEIREKIIEMINSMDIKENNKLPSEKQLAEQLGVSRITIRTVLATLEDEGKVFRRHGSGTFVNPHAFNTHTTLYPQVYYSELISRSGYTPSIEILEVKTVPAGSMAPKLNLAPDDMVVSVSKIYKADGVMAIYCIDYLSTSIATPNLRAKLQEEEVSIFIFLAEYTGVTIAWDMVWLEAADSRSVPEIDAYLNLSKGEIKPLLRIDTINYDAQNSPLLYSCSYIDTDIIKYYLVRRNFDEEK